jgi:glycosyltransferase involved in cell wall biosynthesis
MTSGSPTPSADQPLVSIVVPVYNNADDFAECLDSILAQTYRNWDCTIVDNCSSDGSGEIARRYAARDPRIRLVANERHLDVVANHNRAVSQISADSRYCKVMFADDWVFPHCLQEMVAVAERNPSAAIVGAYGLMGEESEVKWAGIPYGNERVTGREIGRRYFLERMNVFGTLHSLLFRSDVVRSRQPFLNETNLHCDREVCLSLLQTHDFAFVFQILSYTRERPGSLSDFARRMNPMMVTEIYEVTTYGRHFLDDSEYRRCLKKRVREYYNFLALRIVLGGRDPSFWEYQQGKLAAWGMRLNRPHLAWAVLARIGSAVLHPGETLHRLRRKNRGMVRGTLPGA